jgi:flagellar hook-basal body complex protein FliE
MVSKVTSPAALAYLTGQQFSKPVEETGDFASLLGGIVNSTSQTGKRADALSAQAASGLRPDVVEVVTAVAESKAALETLVAVRDKVVQAYDDIMRMPI